MPTYQGYTFGQGDPAGQSFTVATNNIVVAFVQVQGGGSSPTTASFGGVSGVLIDTGTTGQGAPGSSFYFFSVPTGSQTFSTNSGGTDNDVSCWYLTGAATSSPIDAHSPGNATGATTVTLNTANDFIIGWLYDGVSGSSPLTSPGVRQPFSSTHAAVDNAANPQSTGSFTNTWTGSAQGRGWIVAVKPAAAGPANVKTFDGVTQSTGIKTYFGVALASTKTVDGIS